MAQEREARINSEITASEVRLIGVEGEQVGVVPIGTAQQMAEQAEVDLVEIAPGAAPPVCRLMDYGKFKYRESKKRHEAKLKQKQIVVKEVKFRPGTDEGDYQIKLRNLIRFLDEGDKTKVTLRFRGREMAHQEFGIRLLERIRADLEPHGVVEQFPKMEGRQMIMVLSPKKVLPKPAAKAAPAPKPVAQASAARAKSSPV
ncbi:MAG: translation initiation factor IF-3 [Burkholderiales bacterium]|nr:translation initiation factor IF-3 [Burkholderiales bacterium]